MYGDEKVSPNPCLGPIDKGPFYGARVYPGDIGTKGGLVINDDAQVVDEAGVPIEGFYAAGNSTASIMGDVYPGAGCTLGPALTMGFRAANHIMASNSGRLTLDNNRFSKSADRAQCGLEFEELQKEQEI